MFRERCRNGVGTVQADRRNGAVLRADTQSGGEIGILGALWHQNRGGAGRGASGT